MLGRNVACPGGNVQPRGGIGEGLYGGRGGQIMHRWEETGGGYRGGENTFNRGGNQMGPWRDPNAMEVDRNREGDRKCYYCGGFGHIVRNCWKKRKARVVDAL